MAAVLRFGFVLGAILGFAGLFAAAGVALAALAIVLADDVSWVLGIGVGWLVILLLYITLKGLTGIIGDLRAYMLQDERSAQRLRSPYYRYGLVLIGTRVSHIAFFATCVGHLARHAGHAWWLGALGGVAVSLIFLSIGDDVDDDLVGILFPHH